MYPTPASFVGKVHNVEREAKAGGGGRGHGGGGGARPETLSRKTKKGKKREAKFRTCNY